MKHGIRSARVYVTSHGLYELHPNGRRARKTSYPEDADSGGSINKLLLSGI